MSRATLAEILSLPPKRTLSDDVVVRLREAISSAELAPGERLSEARLAEMMGVSRGPIREALTQLEREGLVFKQPNKGAFVARLSREDLDEVYSLRLALERLAVSQAIRQAQPQYLADMQAIVDLMAVDVDRGSTEQTAAELDVRFHDLLYQSANHKRLYACWATLRPQIHIFLLTRNVVNSDFRQMTVQGHQYLLEVIRSRNEERAIAAFEAHLGGAYERIVNSYSQLSAAGPGHNPTLGRAL